MRMLLRTSIVVSLLAPAPTVLAHGDLVAASPGPWTVVAASPAAVRIEFSEGIEPRLSGLTVTGPDGKLVPTGELEVQRAVMTAPLARPLEPGVYRVRWRVLSVDGHDTKGSYTFEVRP